MRAMDGVKGIPDGGVAMYQSINTSYGAGDMLMIFGEYVQEIALIEVTGDNEHGF